MERGERRGLMEEKKGGDCCLFLGSGAQRGARDGLMHRGEGGYRKGHCCLYLGLSVCLFVVAQ